jgi:hypothetical protein
MLHRPQAYGGAQNYGGQRPEYPGAQFLEVIEERHFPR